MTEFSSEQQVQIVLTGAYGNIGDAVIRRRALQWVRSFGVIHAYVGNAPDSWIEQMGLGSSDVIYRASSRAAWVRSFFARAQIVAFVFDPGEVPLGRKDLKSEVIFLLLTIAARIRGATVIRPPRGLGETHRVTLFVHRLAARFSQEAMWRNRRSTTLMRRGRSTPDIAFQELRQPGQPFDGRRLLVVSMRGKRPFPSDAWIEVVSRLAQRGRLEIVCLSQVREDETRSMELAERLGARWIEWGSSSDLEQEWRLREVYGEAKIVISDRLHVLILSAQAGAVPFEVADSPKGKVAEHFEQIGVVGVSLDTSSTAPEAALARIDAAVSDRDMINARIDEARSALDDIEADVRAALQRT